MTLLTNFLCIISSLFCAVSIKAEHCFPGEVPNLTLTNDYQLQWSEVDNPGGCTINGYLVNIFDLEDHALLQYQTNSLTFSLPTLVLCKTYAFEVHAITDQNVVGPSYRIKAKIPSPAYMNLSLVLDNVALNKDNQVLLTWEPNADIAKCISYYRVVYWDETNKPTDVYVSSNRYRLEEELVPCMKYSFQVNAIVNNPDSEGPISEITWNHFTKVPSPPRLLNLTTDTNSVNMTWKLPSFAETRCELTGLAMDTLGLPTNTSISRFNITDSRSRPNVEVVLTDLSPNTVYLSQVTLENSAGSSKAVTVTFQTSDDLGINFKRDLRV